MSISEDDFLRIVENRKKSERKTQNKNDFENLLNGRMMLSSEEDDDTILKKIMLNLREYDVDVDIVLDKDGVKVTDKFMDKTLVFTTLREVYLFINKKIEYERYFKDGK